MNSKLKQTLFILAIALFLVVIFLVLAGGKEKENITVVNIRDVEVPVVVRRTPEELRQGLSGTKSLADNAGMLFVMPEKARHSFWMPNMNFPLDLVWITGGRVVDITADVPNSFDPEHPIVYRPEVPVDYVLEVNAGFMARHGLKEGDEVELVGVE
ncbi:MAG: uncharacterized protein QG665_331 [Patescibacteria group bacterium]|nr:uncharacterized protein [Patescibacteria group bacterium]